MITVAIMQPTFLPWVGYFDLIDQVDHFIFLDNVAFSKQSWQQRNRIRTQAGLAWVTLPVSASHDAQTTIAHARVSDLRPLQKARLTIAQAYARAANAGRELPAIERYLAGIRIGDSLAETNIAFIQAVCERLGRKPRFHHASALPARASRAERLVDLVRAVGGDDYLSPLGAAAYLKTEDRAFADAGIPLRFQHYQHPVWRQAHAPFLPYASVIDLLLNEGEGAAEIIRSGRRDSFTPAQAYALTATANINETQAA